MSEPLALWRREQRAARRRTSWSLASDVSLPGCAGSEKYDLKSSGQGNMSQHSQQSQHNRCEDRARGKSAPVRVLARVPRLGRHGGPERRESSVTQSFPHQCCAMRAGKGSGDAPLVRGAHPGADSRLDRGTERTIRLLVLTRLAWLRGRKGVRLALAHGRRSGKSWCGGSRERGLISRDGACSCERASQ